MFVINLSDLFIDLVSFDDRPPFNNFFIFYIYLYIRPICIKNYKNKH